MAERTVYIACERGRTGIAVRAYEVGAFAAVAGIECAVKVPDSWEGPGQVVQVTMTDEHAYTAIRIQFGHMFVQKPEPKPPVSATSRKSPYGWVDKLREMEEARIRKGMPTKAPPEREAEYLREYAAILRMAKSPSEAKDILRRRLATWK